MKKQLKAYLNGLIQFSLIIVGIIPSNILRKLIYKYIYQIQIGKHSNIHMGARIRYPSRISIGNNTIIGDHTILDGRRGLQIGNNVNISTGVWIWTLQHDLQDSYFSPIGGPVSIEDYVWLSCRSVILPNVTIKKGSVIAAGAVVTNDVDSYKIVAGIPAKTIGERTSDLKYSLKSKVPFI